MDQIQVFQTLLLQAVVEALIQTMVRMVDLVEALALFKVKVMGQVIHLQFLLLKVMMEALAQTLLQAVQLVAVEQLKLVTKLLNLLLQGVTKEVAVLVVMVRQTI
tara:strand:+ start:481 stop:795 length:315 start_codon:yes stop_codon:yes gene_type:complete